MGLGKHESRENDLAHSLLHEFNTKNMLYSLKTFVI